MLPRNARQHRFHLESPSEGRFGFGMCGSPLPLWVFHDSFVSQIAEQGMGADYLASLDALSTTPMLIAMFAVTIVAGLAGAYIARCIYTGAFFGLREDGRMFLWLCVAWVVSGAAVVARALSRGGLVVDGMLTDHCLSILMALIYLAALVAMALKRRRDAREEAEE